MEGHWTAVWCPLASPLWGCPSATVTATPDKAVEQIAEINEQTIMYAWCIKKIYSKLTSEDAGYD